MVAITISDIKRIDFCRFMPP